MGCAVGMTRSSPVLLDFQVEPWCIHYPEEFLRVPLRAANQGACSSTETPWSPWTCCGAQVPRPWVMRSSNPLESQPKSPASGTEKGQKQQILCPLSGTEPVEVTFLCSAMIQRSLLRCRLDKLREAFTVCVIPKKIEAD